MKPNEVRGFTGLITNPINVGTTAVVTIMKSIADVIAKGLVWNQKLDQFDNPDHSIVRESKLVNVQPLVILEDNLLGLDVVRDLQLTLTNLFAGYYVQTFQLLNLKDVRILKTLERLSPNKDENVCEVFKKDPASAGKFIKAVTERLSLPDVSSSIAPTMESIQYTYEKDDDEKPKPKVTNGLALGEQISQLAVGRLLELTVLDGQEKVTIPVSIRLRPKAVTRGTAVHIITGDTPVDRWDGWRSGELEFWKDIVWCNHVIDKGIRYEVKDKSGLAKHFREMKESSAYRGVITGQPDLGNITNMAVITKATEGEIVAALGGTMSAMKTRKQIFNSMGLIMLCVIDEDWETVTIYTRGLKEPATYNFNQMKTISKSSSTADILTMMQAFSNNRAPTL